MLSQFGGDDLIYNWMCNRNTIEFLGIWEQIHNPDFKGVGFDTFKKEAGLNSFILAPKKWIEAILVVLSKLESINSVLIHQGKVQPERLLQLNNIAITQMRSLINSKQIKGLK